MLRFEKHAFNFDPTICLAGCPAGRFCIYMIYIFIQRELNQDMGTVEPNQEMFSRCVLDGDLECQIGGNYWGLSKSITQ